MKMQLIQGVYSQHETIELVSELIQTKIRFLERMIQPDSSEEDIKNRESKIKRMQHELFELRNILLSKNNNCKIEAIINIE